MSMPYDEMCEYYRNIMSKIYDEIEKEQPTEYLDNFKAKYGEEYQEAYSWLQKAGWRLSEVMSMNKHYTEPEFKHFALENLSNIQHRIDSYLNETDFKFSEEVYDYHKYDDIVAERMELINDSDHHKYWKYYYELHSREQKIEHFNLERNWIITNLEDLEHILSDDFDNEWMLNKKDLCRKITALKKEVSSLELEVEELKP